MIRAVFAFCNLYVEVIMGDTNRPACLQALLTRVAKTCQGAVELLRCGLVAQLIECQVFDMVPDSDSHR